MTASFVAYIDESGDEGFVFHPDGSGSSRWFVLTAVVIRKERDAHEIVPKVRELRALLGTKPNHPLHFRNLRHEQRIPVARLIGSLPVRVVSIVIHKPCIREPENFQRTPYALYRYASRLLLERVSWLCAGARRPGVGDGRVELIYSNRSKMSYDDLLSYLERLRSVGDQVRIDWTTVDPQLVRAVNHDKLAGLQLADAAASGMFYAVNPSRYGETEDRYLRVMAPTVYRHSGNCKGYGVKFWCYCPGVPERIIQVVDQQ